MCYKTGHFYLLLTQLMRKGLMVQNVRINRLARLYRASLG